LINPTVNFQVGDLQRLPVPRKSCPPELRTLVLEAIDVARSLEKFQETSPDFTFPPPWPNGCEVIHQKNQRLMEIQHEVDWWVYQLYDLGPDDRKLIEDQTSPDNIFSSIDLEELAFRWISYAVGAAFGRYSRPSNAETKFLYPLLPSDSEGLSARVKEALEEFVGSQDAQAIIQQVNPSGLLHKFLIESFFRRHFSQFEHRPIYWLLKRKKQLFAMYYPAFDCDKRIDFAVDWNLKQPDIDSIRNFDNGIVSNLKILRKYLAITAWKRIFR
jgi:hypothetical protein